MSILSDYLHKRARLRKTMNEMFEVLWSKNLSEDVKYKIVRDVRDTDLATGMREIHLDCPTMAAFMTEENVKAFLTNLERVLGREPVDQSAGCC